MHLLVDCITAGVWGTATVVTPLKHPFIGAGTGLEFCKREDPSIFYFVIFSV